MVTKMRVAGKNTMLPSQKGIVQSTTALKMLFEDIKTRFGAKYILTYRLNQDVLENFFGIIRAKGGLHDHPDQQEFKYRLRSYLLGINKGEISTMGNTEEDDTPDQRDFTTIPLTATILQKLPHPEERIDETLIPEEEDLPPVDALEKDAFEYFAGYVCYRLKDQMPEIQNEAIEASTSATWVEFLSEGGLKKPSEALTNKLLECEQIFKSLNGDDLLISDNYLKQHLQNAKNIDCSLKIKSLFFRSRMYFSIKKLNRKIVEDSYKVRRKQHNTVN